MWEDVPRAIDVAWILSTDHREETLVLEASLHSL